MTGDELKARIQAASPAWAVNVSGLERQWVLVADGDLSVEFVLRDGEPCLLSMTVAPYTKILPERLLHIINAALGLEIARRVPVRGAYSESDRDIERRHDA